MVIAVEGEEGYEITVWDIIGVVKAEGIYLTLGKDGTVLVHPGDNEPREDILEIITEFSQEIAEWLANNSYWDA